MCRKPAHVNKVQLCEFLPKMHSGGIWELTSCERVDMCVFADNIQM